MADILRPFYEKFYKIFLKLCNNWLPVRATMARFIWKYIPKCTLYILWRKKVYNHQWYLGCTVFSCMHLCVSLHTCTCRVGQGFSLPGPPGWCVWSAGSLSELPMPSGLHSDLQRDLLAPPSQPHYTPASCLLAPASFSTPLPAGPPQARDASFPSLVPSEPLKPQS